MVQMMDGATTGINTRFGEIIMNDLFVFNKTIQGYSHILKGRPCEDFSDTYIDEEKKYCIIAVADGHGSDSCFRSNKGSEFAVNAAIDCLKEFADYYLGNKSDDSGTYSEIKPFVEQIGSKKERDALKKQLTDSIIYQWNEKVKKDIEQNPISDEEIETSGEEYVSLYKEGKKLNHIYGTTLMAALWLNRYLIIIHQGDGRCDVFYDDGSVDQPVPWDDKCHENVTTSMCDDDAAQKIRYAIIDTSEKGVAACYLGSDGVEDSYRTMEGTHVFYMKLSNKISDDKNDVLNYLDEYLPEFSKLGSGDDVSVAGIVDTNKISSLRNLFEEKINKYVSEESSLQLKAKIDSMSRKHSILKKQKENSEHDLITQFIKCKNAYRVMRSYEMALKETENINLSATEMLIILKDSCPSAYNVLLNLSSVGMSPAGIIFDTEYNNFLSLAEKKYSEASSALKNLSIEFEKANNEFSEYDSKYQELIEQLRLIEESINTK